MAEDDDADQRIKRAAELRERIAGIAKGQPGHTVEKSGKDSVGPGEAAHGDAPAQQPPSPRDFVKRRMRELDEGGPGTEGKT